MLSPMAVGDHHLGQPVLDDVHLLNAVALTEDDRTGGEPPALQTPQDARRVFRGQPLEK